MAEIAIIGIGNPFRGDDAAGWAVIEALEKKIPSQIYLDKVHGEMTEILDSFEKFSTIYLIDACAGDEPLGNWKRIDALEEPIDFERAQTSTHGLSISQAVSLAKNLNQLPSRLIVYAIFGEQYPMSQGLSPEVEKAISPVVDSILKEKDIQACMRKV